ncbi:phenylacetate--CoA ligase family protein [Marinobacter lacisalsi]|uniref:Phenylacetate--CoA ligase family protein n=1 Tax=Marinobacter lacisalsi TaxID=475979 RepID=A0ABV8QHC2_9GAMM
MASLQEQIYNSSPVWLQNVLVSAYGYRLYRKRYAGVFEDIRELLRHSRTWSQQETEAWQAEQLHNMITHCRHTVPYYQRLFAEYGLHENDFTNIKDVQKLPILTKATLRKNIDSFRSTEGRPYIVQHTSGSTGTPLALEVDEYTYKLAMALVVDHEEFHGVPFGAPRATFAGRMIQRADRMKPPFARYNRAENQTLFSSYHLNDGTFPWYKDALNHLRPREIIGYPSAISDLASHYQKTDTRPSFTPTVIITNSETLLSWQREKIETVFNCPVYDYYGTAEYVLFAGQENGHDYRLNPIIGITEIVDINNEPAFDGRLIANTLSNKIMPLLRYEIGDSGVAIKRSSTSPTCHTIKQVTGRVDDYIKMPDGRCLGRLDHIFKGVQGLIEAQIIQSSPDHCTIKAVFESAPSNTQLDTLTRNFQDRTASQLKLTIQLVDSIPRGKNGKFRSVVQQLDGKS